MDRFEPVYCDAVYPRVRPSVEMEPVENGDWVRYSDHATRIRELEQQLAAMTAERDSESRWAKKYSDEADELRQQLAAAQENTLGPWFLTQGLCTLDAIADHIITLQRQLAAAQEQLALMTASRDELQLEKWRNAR